MNVLDLFSGIGGFSLGLERAGMTTVAFCEIDPYCRAVLAKHWPGVPTYDDVRTLTAERLAADGIAADVICGGFPCQDISLAGKGAGLDGERSGLWREFYRLIAEIRPRYAIIENVSALRSRGLDQVLGALAEIWYDAEWHCIPAAAVGAPHRRDRVWIVAYAARVQPGRPEPRTIGERVGAGCEPEFVANANSSERRSLTEGRDVGDGHDAGRQEAPSRSAPHGQHGGEGDVADAYNQRLEIRLEGDAGQQPPAIGGGWWELEPDVGRVAHGVPARVDRLKALGNAVVPQIPEIIGRAIMRAEGLAP